MTQSVNSWVLRVLKTAFPLEHKIPHLCFKIMSASISLLYEIPASISHLFGNWKNNSFILCCPSHIGDFLSTPTALTHYLFSNLTLKIFFATMCKAKTKQKKKTPKQDNFTDRKIEGQQMEHTSVWKYIMAISIKRKKKAYRKEWEEEIPFQFQKYWLYLLHLFSALHKILTIRLHLQSPFETSEVHNLWTSEFHIFQLSYTVMKAEKLIYFSM